MTSVKKRINLYGANPDIADKHACHTLSIYAIRELFMNEGFEILEERNSFFLFAVFGLRRKGKLDEWDCRLADYLLRFMASGWYFILKPLR